jgi:methyl-accepting chemotaxis protein
MDAMTRENAALGEQAAAASRAMRENATALLHEVGFFTLAETTPPPPPADDVGDDVAEPSPETFASPLPVAA